MSTASTMLTIPTGARSPRIGSNVAAYLVYPGGNIIGHDDSFVFGSYGKY